MYKKTKELIGARLNIRIHVKNNIEKITIKQRTKRNDENPSIPLYLFSIVGKNLDIRVRLETFQKD